MKDLTKAEQELYDLGYTKCKESIDDYCTTIKYTHNLLTDTHIDFIAYHVGYKLVSKKENGEIVPLEVDEIKTVYDILKEMQWL